MIETEHRGAASGGSCPAVAPAGTIQPENPGRRTPDALASAYWARASGYSKRWFLRVLTGSAREGDKVTVRPRRGPPFTAVLGAPTGPDPKRPCWTLHVPPAQT